MFKIDEKVVKLGIIGPFPSSQIEAALHLAVNEGKGELDGPWSLSNNTDSTFSISYKHASNQGVRMSESRISGLAYLIRLTREDTQPSSVEESYLWVDRIARRRLGGRQVNWGNLGLAPYGLSRTVLAPQWDECVIADEHKRMWLRMEAVLSACCQGYFVHPDEEDRSCLLTENFREVLSPSKAGQYPGMRYSSENALKELAVSVMCGNWDTTLTSFEQDKIDARDWAGGVTEKLKADTSFMDSPSKRMVMRQLFTNDIYLCGRQLVRPADIGEMSDARRGGVDLEHPWCQWVVSHYPLTFRTDGVNKYSNVVGKTVIVLSESGDEFVSVDDCGWGLPVGHCGLVHDFDERGLTGRASHVRTLRAVSGMSAVLYTFYEATEGLGLRKACFLVQHITRIDNDGVKADRVIIVATERIHFSWSA